MLVCLLALPAAATTYTYSNAPGNATTYPWIDTASGTNSGLGDDAVTSSISIGFNFTLGGTTYSQLRIASNGMVQFGGTSTAWTNAALPLNGASGKPNIDAVLLPLWDDLSPTNSGASIRYKRTGSSPNQVFTITWNAVAYYCSYSAFAPFDCSLLTSYATSNLGLTTITSTFQVQLHENGTIVYRYGDVHGNGGSHSNSRVTNPSGATIGLEITNSDYVQYAYRSASIANGTTLVWTQVPAVLTSGQRISLEAYDLSGSYVRHSGGLGWVDPVSVDSTTSQREDASFTARPGLWNSSCWSFESVNNPGYYLRHSGFRLYLNAYSTDTTYRQDATFCARTGLADATQTSFESWNYPGRYLSRGASDNTLWIATNSGGTFNGRATFGVGTALADQPSLVASYHFEELAYTGATNELQDAAGHPSGPFHGKGYTSPYPSAAVASPALSGDPGSCGYATLPGPASGGGHFRTSGLPVSTTDGARHSVAFWMYWNGTDGVHVLGFNKHSLRFYSGSFGFSTRNFDIYGISASGLASGWHHVAAVFTNGSVSSNRLFIDGVAQTLTQRTGSPNLLDAVVQSTLIAGGFGYDSSGRFDGRIDELQFYVGEIDATAAAALAGEGHSCPATLHHIEIQHGSGTGLTCAPSTLTIAACQDAACTIPYAGALTGSLTASGGTVVWPSGNAFSILAGTGLTTLPMQMTSVGTTALGVSGPSVTPSNSTTCNFGAPTCTFAADDAGLFFDVPHHVSNTAQAITVAAVRRADNSLACVPGFSSVTKPVQFSCSYANPTSGTLPVRVAGAALNSGNNASAACDGTGRSVSLNFNVAGLASTTVQYADVGQMGLSATYTGSGADAGLVMTGSDSFIAAPASLGITGITAGPIRAGANFAATVTALNASGTATPNFGRETSPASVALSFTRHSPVGVGTYSGSFSAALGSFSGGAATTSAMSYDEVGRIDLQAALANANYLGSGLNATGTTGIAGAVGDFIPNHFTTTVTQACAAGGFSYAGQPVQVLVQAHNAAGLPTRNYAGALAQSVTLTDAGSLGLGSFSNASIAAGAFAAGAASATPSYAFTAKLTAPQSLVLRASNGLSGAQAVSSSGRAEGSTLLRSGRVRLSNAFGSATAPLQIPATLEYWTGQSWAVHSADTCTSLPITALVKSQPLTLLGAVSTAVTLATGGGLFTAGQQMLTLGAPSPAGSGLSVTLALNLGSGVADQSCNSSHPVSVGANLPWLRSQHGSCSPNADRDPAARAAFGVFGTPEAKRTVHVRDLY